MVFAITKNVGVGIIGMAWIPATILLGILPAQPSRMLAADTGTTAHIAGKRSHARRRARQIRRQGCREAPEIIDHGRAALPSTLLSQQ